MNNIKIGQYIASKRKEKGLTQKQLAEKLGIGDKAVSKWERGICLPDVSKYLIICEILGISLNEFLAGEDIQEDNIKVKSEDNIMTLIKESSKKIKNLKYLVTLMVVIFIVSSIIIGGYTFKTIDLKHNNIRPFDDSEVVLSMFSLSESQEEPNLFRYNTQKFNKLIIYVSEYKKGKLTSKKSFEVDNEHNVTSGMIGIIPDIERKMIKISVTSRINKNETEGIDKQVNILKNMTLNRYATHINYIKEAKRINYNKEQGLATSWSCASFTSNVLCNN